LEDGKAAKTHHRQSSLAEERDGLKRRGRCLSSSWVTPSNRRRSNPGRHRADIQVFVASLTLSQAGRELEVVFCEDLSPGKLALATGNGWLRHSRSRVGGGRHGLNPAAGP
jgi:hypothetical protein